MSDKKRAVPVPNVTGKTDKKEQARLHAQIGNLRQQNAQFVLNEEGKTRTLEGKGEEKASEAGLDLKAIPSMYFNQCKNGVYTIDHRTSKILIEGCEDTTIIINGKVLTSTIEVWKCKNMTLVLNTKVKTLQLDIMTGMKCQFRTLDDFQAIVWQDVDTIGVSFEKQPQFNLNTSFESMLAQFPDSEAKIDQFIIRLVPILGEGLQPERCVRLKNGHLSTEREAAEWDMRNNAAKEKFKDAFCKEAGITINKKEGKKIQPNAECPLCESGKKYKKCCMNKKEISGLHETQKAKTYQPSKNGAVVETKEN